MTNVDVKEAISRPLESVFNVAALTLWLCWSSGLAVAQQPSGTPITISNITEGRPAGIYQLQINNNAAICDSILSSFNKPAVPVRHTRLERYAADYALKNELSVTWTELEGFPDPAYRAVVDLDNDGTPDVIYRVPFHLAGRASDDVLWTDKFPAHEASFSVERYREVLGKPLVAPWADHWSGQIYRYQGTISNGDLPQGLTWIDFLYSDVISVLGRNLLTVSTEITPNKPLYVAVLEVRTPRSHALVCLLKSRGVLQLGRKN